MWKTLYTVFHIFFVKSGFMYFHELKKSLIVYNILKIEVCLC